MLEEITEFKKGRKLGEGSFGAVYLVRDRLGNLCALKEMLKSKLPEEKFEHEAEMMGRLSHPNIISFFYHFSTPETYNIVMEYCNSYSLRHGLHLETDNKLDEDVCQKVFSQLSKALHYMNTRKITHFDIKPDNILTHNYSATVSRITKTTKIKIADFGAAERQPLSQKKLKGTYAYMAPEMYLQGEYEENVDLWSLGVTFYECVFGKHPACRNGRHFDKPIIDTWHRLKQNQLIFPEQHNASETCIQLLKGLLNRDPTTRINFSQLVGHPFFSRQQVPN